MPRGKYKRKKHATVETTAKVAPAKRKYVRRGPPKPKEVIPTPNRTHQLIERNKVMDASLDAMCESVETNVGRPLRPHEVMKVGQLFMALVKAT